MKLKIATINFWGAPFPLTTNKKRRFNKLVQIIENEKFDILAIQELWMNPDFRALRKKFPEYHFYKRKGFIFNPSGLVLMSRFPLFDKQYTSFTPANLSPKIIWEKLTFKESFFTKGMIRASIKIDDEILKIINVHLNYSHDPNILNSQYSKIFSSTRVKNNLILGDFNSDVSDLILPPGYKIMSDLKHPTLEIKNPYSVTTFNKFHHKQCNCDLILTNVKCEVMENKTDNKNIISDHYLVWTKIRI